jgi:transposase
MEKQRNKVCGVDVHKRFSVATCLSRDGSKKTKEFTMDLEGLFEFKEWVIGNGCEVVAFESTGNYWIPIFTFLEGDIELIVGNAYQIKHIPGRKTDLRDSEWIAELCLNGMINPSRIFSKEDRELRSLTRAREGYVKMITQTKNRIHHILESANIKISSKISDIFGKSGMHILNGLLDGTDIDEIIEGIPATRVKKKADEIRRVIGSCLDLSQVILIKGNLDIIKELQTQIDKIDHEIESRIMQRKDDLEIAMSMPGIGFTSASTILAEIGDYRDFDTPGKLASWCGLTASVYQSGGKNRMGGITKQGSKHIRWILVEIAYAASRKRGSKLKNFFNRVRARKGSKVAIVALARKIICILYHLLIKQEMYEEEGMEKPKSFQLDRTSSPIEMTVKEMIEIIVKAGYMVKKREPGGCG